jgi:hypothetical protein
LHYKMPHEELFKSVLKTDVVQKRHFCGNSLCENVIK